MADVAIEFNGLSKRFGNLQAVHDLSFSVEFGRVTGFLGPNGAGKSTTLRTLLGLIHPNAGTATFGGARYPLPTPAAAGTPPDSRVGEVFEQVGLPAAADRRVKGYSMGMRQRLA